MLLQQPRHVTYLLLLPFTEKYNALLAQKLKTSQSYLLSMYREYIYICVCVCVCVCVCNVNQQMHTVLINILKQFNSVQFN